MEGHGDSSPFWPQPQTSDARRRTSSPLLTPPLLIILFPIITLILLFFAVPPFFSFSSQIFAISRVKKSLDTLNVLLVLVAVICGIFARRNDADESNDVTKPETRANDAVRDRWLQSGGRKMYGSPARTPFVGAGRLKRNSNSYPDLRQEYSLSEAGERDDRIRFFDDFGIDKCRSPDFHSTPLRRLRSTIAESDIKVIPVDTFVLRPPTPPPANPPTQPMAPAPPPRPQTPPPAPPPPPAVVRKRSRTYHTVGAPPTNPPPPPPPTSPPQPFELKQSEIHQVVESSPPSAPSQPPVCGHKRERRLGKMERTKSNATKELKMVIATVQTALYIQKTKKKRKNRTIYEIADQSSPETQHTTTATPPPPPPPPPLPSVFHNLFRKASKSKKIHSVPPPAPPPPPPPRAITTMLWPSRKSKTSSSPPPPPPPPLPPVTMPERSGRRRDLRTSSKPPRPPKPTSYKERDINSNSYFNGGSQSPLIPTPPPPPPPLKTPEVRFVHFRSNHCSSPELVDVDISSAAVNDPSPPESSVDGTSSGGRIFCPSPDINIKADTFIARLRDGWKLEKINSMREKQSVGPTV